MPSTCVNKNLGLVVYVYHLRGRDRRILGTYWPVRDPATKQQQAPSDGEMVQQVKVLRHTNLATYVPSTELTHI